MIRETGDFYVEELRNSHRGARSLFFGVLRGYNVAGDWFLSENDKLHYANSCV
jgi:hypothetical protein